MSVREDMKAAREALSDGRFGEFAARALELEAASAAWTAGTDGAGLRAEAAAMATTLAHVSAVRDRLLALRGGASGYQSDGSLIAPAAQRLSREA